MDRYDRMARVIHYLDQNFREQPSLETLAAVAGLSIPHFHREFRHWTGITPKDFVQGLTLRYVKERLAAGESVLHTALEAGLSGPGRLHDLCVTLTSMSPGELKNQGQELQFRYGRAESPFGECFFSETERGLHEFRFITQLEDSPEQALRQAWPKAKFLESNARASELINQLFGTNPSFSGRELKLRVRATAFQFQVWQALLNIPEGNLVTYAGLGEQIGKPQSARAIGNAVGANPLGVIIPCHRVIRKTGLVEGYRWGTGRKRALIAWEAGRERR